MKNKLVELVMRLKHRFLRTGRGPRTLTLDPHHTPGFNDVTRGWEADGRKLAFVTVRPHG